MEMTQTPNDRKQRILFVDDEPNILAAYRRTLRGFSEQWEFAYNHCPAAAWRRLQIESFDLVVCDVRMPGMTGLELLEKVKNNEQTSDIPVVIVTGNADRDLKRRALDLDATDLLNKPVDPNELIARIRNALRMKACADELKQHKEHLEECVRRRTAELTASREDIIWRLGKAAEFRDEETGNHVIRVACYSRAIARNMGMSEEFCETLFLAAPLHDIGKIGIADDVLLKPGKLNDEQWETMKRHCEIGVSILSEDCKFRKVVEQHTDLATAHETLGESQGDHSIRKMAITVAATHHERWDGEGYPYKLAGKAIPLASRIVAIADVYDALRSRRPYKEPFSVSKSLAILEEGSGSHFDPAVVESFMEIFDEIGAIETQFSDHSETADTLSVA